MEQALAEAALQTGNGLRDGRLGEVELGSGAGKGAGFGNFGKYGPGFEIGEREASILETMCFERFYFSTGSTPHLSTSTSEIAQSEAIT